MVIDIEKVDETVLALLYLTLHDDDLAWKAFDWETMNRLHGKGFIDSPISKAKSVALTEKGIRESERLFKVIGNLRASGRGIVYVSHRMDEVMRIADRVTVLRDGETVATRPIRDVTAASADNSVIGSNG